MPWKECSVMEERLRFVARLLEGEAMSELAREFGISRKTGLQDPQSLPGGSNSRRSATARAGRSAMPTNCPIRSD